MWQQMNYHDLTNRYRILSMVLFCDTRKIAFIRNNLNNAGNG